MAGIAHPRVFILFEGQGTVLSLPSAFAELKTSIARAVYALRPNAKALTLHLRVDECTLCAVNDIRLVRDNDVLCVSAQDGGREQRPSATTHILCGGTPGARRATTAAEPATSSPSTCAVQTATLRGSAADGVCPATGGVRLIVT
uniref:Uncharacterized protein n=1 Tax=Coccolithus braarudii TaxID=221442 RepID=A0A7S0Q0Z2_9EUKA|mmetsp:Transcript_22365/g.48267  ORF Transcript_22365/g.48267 Transcript_22365/m.48267 type:complete len:145 (+) Transcript_22365:46-480(+)